MKVIAHFAEARQELRHAIALSPDPVAFRQDVDQALQAIASGLIAHARIPRSPCRECGLTRLPYSIIYTETPDEIRVVAFAHHKRKRGYWKTRLRRP